MRITCMILALAFAVVSLPGHAALLSGNSIQTEYFFPDLSTLFSGPHQTIVGLGPEVGIAPFTVDFSDTNILITATGQPGQNNVAFDGFRFFDWTGAIPAIANVVINPATNYGGPGAFAASRVTFDANTILVNVANLPGMTGEVISLDLTGPSTIIPEPSTVLFIGGGLVLFAVRRLTLRGS